MVETYRFHTLEEQTFWEWIKDKVHDHEFKHDIQVIMKSAKANTDGTFNVNLVTKNDQYIFEKLTIAWEREEELKEHIVEQMYSPSMLTH